MKFSIERLLASNAPASTILIRLMVGGVFLSEGIQKFLEPASRGGSGFWGLHLKEVSSYGFWSMAHEARTDFAMLLGSLFLLRVGAGPLALDGSAGSLRVRRRRKP